MKTSNIIIGIFLLISLVSCEQSMTEDQYCFNLKHNSLKSVILPKNQLDSIKELFDYNHLDYSKFQFYHFKVDELGYHHVSCYQFKNNGCSQHMQGHHLHWNHYLLLYSQQIHGQGLVYRYSNCVVMKKEIL